MSYGWAAETSNVSEISTIEFSKGVYTPSENSNAETSARAKPFLRKCLSNV